MASFFGDFDTSETVYIPFNTFDSNDPSASVTITNLVSTDVHIHKDGSATQRSSANGVTVTIDFDSITGNHLIAIDLSDNTDAGYYANGSQYAVRIEGTTVDAATINAWVGAFSIGRTLRPTTAGRTLDVTATGAAGVDWGNVENASTSVDLSATSINLCDTITTYTGNTVQTGDAFARLGAPAGASVSADIATVDANVDLILADTGTDGVVVASINANAITAAAIAAGAITDTEFTATGSGLSVIITDLDDIKGTAFVKDTHSLVNVEGYVDILDDGTSGNAKIATDVAAVLVDTADMQPKLGTPAADLSADIAAVKTDTANIETDTQNIQSRIPAALVSGRMSSDMVALSGNTTAADNLEESAKGIISGSTSGTPTTTTTDTDLTGYLDDELIGRVIVFTGGTAAGQASDITDYASTNGVVTMTALATAPAASDTFVIV